MILNTSFKSDSQLTARVRSPYLYNWPSPSCIQLSIKQSNQQKHHLISLKSFPKSFPYIQSFGK
jgi:hypothetical protein